MYETANIYIHVTNRRSEFEEYLSIELVYKFDGGGVSSTYIRISCRPWRYRTL